MVELETAAFNRKPDLANFFYDCDGCDYTLRFDWYDQVRDCPKCGRSNSLSPANQAFLRKEKEEIRRWLRSLSEQIEEEKV
jgi:hypothetical protein